MPGYLAFRTRDVGFFTERLARTLLDGYGIDPRLTRLVDTRELWVVPMLNPDGHVFQEQLAASPTWAPPGWRKNRRHNSDVSYGVDLNRNYDFSWGADDAGSSPDENDETYRGPSAFSEPETQRILGRNLLSGEEHFHGDAARNQILQHHRGEVGAEAMTADSACARSACTSVRWA